MPAFLDEELKLCGFGLHLAVLAETDVELGLQLLQFQTQQRDAFIEGVDLFVAVVALPLTALLNVHVREILLLYHTLLALRRLGPWLILSLRHCILIAPDAADEQTLKIRPRRVFLLILERDLGLDTSLLPIHLNYNSNVIDDNRAIRSWLAVDDDLGLLEVPSIFLIQQHEVDPVLD